MHMTHPDQMARNRDRETDKPMFPRGVKQMLGFIYAMEGEAAGRISWHAKMMELREAMERGYLHKVELNTINLNGYDPIMINGECAGLRAQVERELSGVELLAVLTKFGSDEMDRTGEAMHGLAGYIRDYLNSLVERRKPRGIKYCIDLAWNLSCSHILYEKRFNTPAIAKRHQISQATVWLDIDDAKKMVSGKLKTAYRKIEGRFRDGVVLPVDERRGA